MIIYKPIETHSHTKHSDGNFTPEELFVASRERGLAGVVVSDHNTQSAFDYISDELQENTVVAIRAIEWTTFFGHMVVIGGNTYVDWRFATPDTIDDYTNEIINSGGTVGIAHPFEEGDPICTGCFWMFNVTNWDNITYVEVWSTEDPILKYKNLKAFEWWTQLLNKGYKIAATAGTDWHRAIAPEKLAAVTYVGLEDGVVNTGTVVNALENGRTFVTMGPVINLSINQHGRIFYIGDTIESGEIHATISIDNSDRSEIWGKYGCYADKIRIVNNGKVISELDAGDGSEQNLTIIPEKGWLRAELYSNSYHGVSNALVGFTSPIYVN